MFWRIGLLFIGAILLLGVSVAIVSGALRGPTTPPVSANTTVPTSTATPSPSPAATRAITGTNTVASARPTITPASTPSAVGTRTATLANPQATSTTAPLPTVANGGCAMSLPGGYGADPTQIGYFPALDRTGFVALDAFAGADQTPATLAKAFASGTLSRVLTDYQQTGATDLGDRYRIDYRATSNGQSGRGSTQVQVFGEIGCGVTVFALDGATGPLAATFDLLVRSLGPVQAPRTGPATTTP